MKFTPKNAPLLRHAGVLIVPLLLAACGGGGGGGSGATTSTAQPLSLSATNAKPAADDALTNTQTESGASGASVVDALKSQVVGGPGSMPSLLQTSTALAQLVPATGGMKAAVNGTQACPLGGSVSAVGSIASAGMLATGDNVSVTASNCVLTVNGQTATVNGSLSITVNSGGVGASFPFAVSIAFSAVNFRTQVGADTLTINGDELLAWSATSTTAQTLQTSGTSFNIVAVEGGRTHSGTWRNYLQTITLAGTQTTTTMSAQVETVNGRLGSTPMSYQLTTPQAVVSTASGISSGSVLLTGSNHSALLITFTGTNTMNLQVDANGDGTYEQTISSTMAELAALP